MRGISEVAAVALLVLATVAAATLLYLWTSGITVEDKATPTAFCGLHITAYAGADPTGIHVYAAATGCPVRLSSGYLVSPSGSAYRLYAVGTPVLEPGKPEDLWLTPAEKVPPGSYTLKLVASSGVEATTQVKLQTTLAASVTATGTPEQLNNTVIKGQGFTAVFNTTEVAPGSYRLTVTVTPDPGVTATYLKAYILNATLQPPIYIDGWYTYTWQTPFTSTTPVYWYWQPLIDKEAPYTIVISVLTK